MRGATGARKELCRSRNAVGATDYFLLLYSLTHGYSVAIFRTAKNSSRQYRSTKVCGKSRRWMEGVDAGWSTDQGSA